MTRIRTMRSAARVAGLTCLSLACVACTTEGNDRSYLGGGVPGDRAEFEALDAPARPEAPMAPDAPSLTGISRDNWGTLVILIPVDGTSATRTYARGTPWTKDTMRQRGGYPLPTSALEQEGNTTGIQQREALASPFLALWDLLLMGPRMVMAAPWTEVRSIPMSSYWRAPSNEYRRIEAKPAAPPAEATDAPVQAPGE